MEQIVNERNMERAWKKVKANRGAAGPDGVTLDKFFETFRDQWPTVRQQLLDGSYEPSPARRKSIPKPDGSERHLGIPNVQDRLIQQAILQVLTPIFDPGFSESSFGFRRKLGVRARDAYTHGISSKGPWVMSKTETMHIAIMNDYLRKAGLVSLEELWNKFAPKWRIA